MSLNPKLQLAVDRLTISDVTLKSIRASLRDGFDPDLQENGEEFSLQTVFPRCRSITQYEGDDENTTRRRIVFDIFAGLRVLETAGREWDTLTPDQISELVCATIECYFLVKYDDAPEENEPLDEEALKQFAQHNVPFNVWPYWREVVQSACGRMGLPKIVLPTHRLRRSATETSDA